MESTKACDWLKNSFHLSASFEEVILILIGMENGKPFPAFFRDFVQPCLTLLALSLSIEYMLRTLLEFFQDSFLEPYILGLRNTDQTQLHLSEYISKPT